MNLRFLGLAFTVVVIVCLGVAQDPDFNDKMELKGSSTFVESNWNIDGTGSGATNAKAALKEDGLTMTLSTSAASMPSLQFKRQFHVGDGVSWAWYRITISDVDEVGFWVGLYSLEADPTSTEPTYVACFKKDESDTQVDIRTRDNDSGNTDADKFTITDETPFDLVIKMDGELGTNKATFWYRATVTTLWTEVPITASAPRDDANLHFSMFAFNDDSGGVTADMVAGVFEAEAPTDDDLMVEARLRLAGLELEAR